MKRTALIAAGIAALLLAGCSAGPGSDGGASKSDEAPLVAQTQTAPEGDADAAFLKAVREALPAKTQIPDATDEQLIAAAHAACEQLPSLDGDTTQARVIEGEVVDGLGYYADSAIIAAVAAQVYCPQD